MHLRQAPGIEKNELNHARTGITHKTLVRSLLLVSLYLGPLVLHGAQFTGSVRAADQLIPGATVTAHQGETKVIGYTDENGQYHLDLAPGPWNIDIEMFGLTPLHGIVTIGGDTVYKEWTMVVPRINGDTGAALATMPNVGNGRGGRGGRGGQGGRGGFPGGPGGRRGGTDAQGGQQANNRNGGRGQQNGTANPAQNPPADQAPAGRGPQPAGATPAVGRNQNQAQPAFQSVQMTATAEGAQAQAQASAFDSTADAGSADSNDSFMVVGSVSGGLGAASDDQVRRDRAAGRGGPAGDSGINLLGGTALSQLGFNTTDPVGMGAFGAAGYNTGFGADNGGGLGLGAGGGGLPSLLGGGGGGGGGGAVGEVDAAAVVAAVEVAAVVAEPVDADAVALAATDPSTASSQPSATGAGRSRRIAARSRPQSRTRRSTRLRFL